MGRGFLNRSTVDVVSEASAPGVIRSWGSGCTDLAVEGFGIDDFGLADGFVEDGEG